MTKTLNSKQVLTDNDTREPDSITSLTLTLKALSDVSSLREFKNLEKLDLGSNNLSSLEGLKSCINLKWLSVKQNKLRSLNGIEGLTRLTVLNAGFNNLRSMDEVISLTRLRAVILNDNEIISICKLDQLSELNTLVLSRNPICRIGEGLIRNKSVTKLSLAHCQLQDVNNSLKFCTELRELRLGHNAIKTLPAELVHNSKINNLDLGNNFIYVWSDMKVLSLLTNLRNLNLQGNPIAEDNKLATKIKKLVPRLKIFNGRPLAKYPSHKSSAEKGEQKDQRKGGRNLKGAVENFDGRGLDRDEDWKFDGDGLNPKKDRKKNERLKNLQDSTEGKATKDADAGSVRKKVRNNRQEVNGGQKEEALHNGETNTITEKKFKKRGRLLEKGSINVIDDGETPLVDLFTADFTEHVGSENVMDGKAIREEDALAGLVTFPKKSKRVRSRNRGSSALQLLSSDTDVGLGGASTWDDV